MKIVPLLLATAGVSAVCAAGTTAVLMGVQQPAAPAESPTEVARPEVAEPEPAVQVASLDPEEAQRVQSLEARVSELERRLLAARRPVETPEEEQEDLAAMTPADPQARQLVLDVIAQEEAREQAERDARREQKRLDEMNRKADRIAEKIGLPEAQRGELVEVLLAVDEQRDAARDTAQEAGWDSARELFRAIDEYKAEELTKRFGAEVAGQIEEADDRRGGRGGRGGRGF